MGRFPSLAVVVLCAFWPRMTVSGTSPYYPALVRHAKPHPTSSTELISTLSLQRQVINLHQRLYSQLNHLSQLVAEEPLSKRGALSAQLAKLRRGLRYRRDRGLTFSKHALLSLEKRVQPFERGLMRVTEPQAFALRQRAFKRDPGNMMAARDCVDSPLLFKGAWLDGKALARFHPRTAARDELPRATLLPCKREFVIRPLHVKNDGAYITELHGVRCLHAEVHADRPVHACFLPLGRWLKEGGPAAAARHDPSVCPCRGARSCSIVRAELDPGATYVLFVRESKDRSKDVANKGYKGHVKPVHIAVYQESCYAAWAKKRARELVVTRVAVGVGTLALLCACVKANGDRVGRWLAKSKKGTGYSRIGVSG